MSSTEHRDLHSSKLRSASYDNRTQVLEVAFHDRTTLIYRQVPPEVARRLFRAPSPEMFWEDRIAEEYPSTPGRLGANNQEARAALDALFGGGSGKAPRN